MNQPACAPENTRKRIDVALGNRPADLVVINGTLLDVYTGEFLQGWSVSIADQYIAAVTEALPAGIGPQTTVIDAAGKTIIPGLIDSHTHLAWLCSIDRHLQCLAAGGTTTLVTETLEIFPVAGETGLLDFLDSLADQPIKVFATAPAMTSISSRTRGIPAETLQSLLRRPDILGLGEAYWQTVLQHPDQFVPELETARRAGKSLEGHSAGARGRKLNAYVAAGITSCHEPIRAEEVLNLLRLGVHTMIREGSIRRDLAAVASIRKRPVDTRNLILVSDGLSPADLVEKGGMEYVVQKAIDCGFDPVAAVQMATLNAAEHFGLASLLGGIAPGRLADLVLIPDPKQVRAELVISNGRVVAENGRLLVEPRKHAYRMASRQTVQLRADLTAADFRLQAPPQIKQPKVCARVIEMVTELVTREAILEVPVANGEIQSQPGADILKVAAVDRTHQPGKTFVGLIRGFGLKSGAFACSAAWDASDIIVVGAADPDMAAAVNRIRTLQGGAVVCVAGRIQAELALPIFGLLSESPVPEVVAAMDRIQTELQRLGCSFPDPLLTLVTLTGAAIPFLRICEEGLVNLKDGRTVGLFVEDSQTAASET
jgi:adenine deaminase